MTAKVPPGETFAGCALHPRADLWLDVGPGVWRCCVCNRSGDPDADAQLLNRWTPTLGRVTPPPR